MLLLFLSFLPSENGSLKIDDWKLQNHVVIMLYE